MEEASAAVVGLAAAAVAGSGSNSSGLLNGLVQKLWPNINEGVCKEVKASVEPSFKELPSTLKTLHFTELDLGTVPITIDNIIVHDKDQDGSSLQFDMDLVWDGDCNIQLKADYLGSFGVQKIKFHGRLSVILSPLLDVMPIVSAAQVCFINQPRFELDFLGAANIADFSFVSSKIRRIISDIIDDMLVLPNRMYFKVDPANSFLDTYRPPIGVARVTVANGSGFQGKAQAGFLKDAHDVYCLVDYGINQQWQTSTQNNTDVPEWNETRDFLLYDYDQVVKVHAWDEDTGGADDDLGSAQVTVREMLYAAGKTTTLDLQGGTYKGGQQVTLGCQVCKLDIANHQSLDDESNKDDADNRISGLITVLIVGAKNVPIEKKEDAKTFVKVKYGTNEELVTATVIAAPGVDPLNPVYDKAFAIPLRPGNDNNQSIEILLMNDTDTVLGSKTITYDEVAEAGTITMHECSIGEEGATLEFRVSLCGVVEPEDGAAFITADELAKAHATTSSSSAKSKGVVRLTVVKGWGFEVEKRRRLIKRKDIPDIYCNITFGSSPKIWRTKTVRNSVTPEWNESADYVLSNHGQIISMTVFDEDKKRDKDDELGGVRISVGKLLLEGGLDVELMESGKPTGQFISLKCDMVSS